MLAPRRTTWRMVELVSAPETSVLSSKEASARMIRRGFKVLVANLLSGTGESTGLTPLVDGVADPVDASVAADGLVGGVDEDDFKVLVHTVLHRCVSPGSRS